MPVVLVLALLVLVLMLLMMMIARTAAEVFVNDSQIEIVGTALLTLVLLIVMVVGSVASAVHSGSNNRQIMRMVSIHGGAGGPFHQRRHLKSGRRRRKIFLIVLSMGKLCVDAGGEGSAVAEFKLIHMDSRTKMGDNRRGG